MYLFPTLNSATAKKSDLINYCSSFLVAIFILVGICIYYIDQNLTLLFKEDDWVWVIAREITHVGLVTNYFIPAFIIWIGAQILLKWDKSKSRHRIKYIATHATWLMYCFLFSGFFTHLVKLLVGRQRPKSAPDFDAHIFNPLLNMNLQTLSSGQYLSMPSGHTQVLFTLATFISFLFPKYRYGFYLLAFTLAFTRVMTRDHFLSDVILGIAAGHIPTVILLHWLMRRAQPVVIA